jgi:hypothetical protein
VKALSGGMAVVTGERQGPSMVPGVAGASHEGSPRSWVTRQLAHQVEEEAQRLFAMADRLDRLLEQDRLRRCQAWHFRSDGTALGRSNAIIGTCSE